MEHVSVRLESLMEDKTKWDGMPIKGLANYLETIIEQNKQIISLLQRKKADKDDR
jgi:hypothetical protein